MMRKEINTGAQPRRRHAVRLLLVRPASATNRDATAEMLVTVDAIRRREFEPRHAWIGPSIVAAVFFAVLAAALYFGGQR